MRARTATAVFTVTVLGAAAFGAASSMSAATDGLSSDSLMAGAHMGDAFSGATARPADDPDAPIATGRWAENAAPVELAGGPSAQTPTAAPAPEPIRLSRSAAPAASGTARLALLEPAPEQAARAPVSVPLSRLALSSPAAAAPAAPEPRIQLAISEQGLIPPGAGLDLGSSVFSEPIVSLRPSRQSVDIKRMTLRVGPSRVGKKGRWFVFAAGSGQAFGLNLLRDPLRGWKPAGWSVEQLAEFGKAQLGIGWRRDSRQLAVSVARRELGAYGISREDTVFGISFTVSGKPAPKTRFEQRLPRAH